MDNFIVSARKYRPDTFESVVGQKALTATLKNAITSGRLGHAYLFCGPRGVGKTTCARIFAKSINCFSPTPEGNPCNQCESCCSFNEQRSYNIHELDAASNNSVDDIRAIIDQVRIPPQVGNYKVFIVDEVHMLSTAAFNAFLKTLEEPPEHVVFILATTEKHKLLPTIISRCQIYDFTRIELRDIAEHLAYVAREEGVLVEEEALHVIARKADGGMRDALSMFDQMVSFTQGNLTYHKVIENLNILDYDYYFRLTDYCLQRDINAALLLFNEVLTKGFDGAQFIGGFAAHLRDVMVSKDEATCVLLEVAGDVRLRYKEQAKACDIRWLFRALKRCNDCDIHYRASRNKRLLVELTLIQVVQALDDDESGRSPKQITPIFSATSTPVVGQSSLTTASQPPVASLHSEPITPQPTVATMPPPPPPSPVVHSQQSTTPSQRAKVLPKLNMVSIRKPAASSSEGGASVVTAEASTTTPVYQRIQPFTQHSLLEAWLRFANSLPIEQIAMTRRMKLFEPKLLEDGMTFEVVLENDIVAGYFAKLKSQIERYIHEQHGDTQAKMLIRVAAADERVRAYSPREKFMQLVEKHEVVKMMVERLRLEPTV
ncbi:MAG: DNA polymerase III subunit gamma/tau [Bacteroidales bacterium]|nr:DNA polymerase III subunit gamma/tau [Bacteroidales bacterium]